MRVVAYASRTLTSAEKSYCTTRKEQLAMIYGLKQFRPYVLGHLIVIRSDHAPLSFLKRTKEPIGNRLDGLTSRSNFLYSGNIDEVLCMGTRMPCPDGRVKSLWSLADSALGIRRMSIHIKSQRYLTPPNSRMKRMQARRLSPSASSLQPVRESRTDRNPEWWDKLSLVRLQD